MRSPRAIAATMSLTVDDLFTSPDHYLHSFDGDAALFVPMDRAAYHRSIFLDNRISPPTSQSMRLSLRAMACGVRPPAQTSWIFHVAHCGSTLLARALDHLDLNLILREPLALRQLALAPDPQALAITAAMLSKRYRADLPSVVKANVPVNFLLPQLVDFDRDAHAIFLYLSLRDYLLAILRSSEHRSWLSRVTVQLASYLGDLSKLSDAERAASLWLAQLKGFAVAVGKMPNARSLDAEAFFSSPARFVGLAAGHLRVPLKGNEIEAMVAGPLFATYSKNPDVAFDDTARRTRRQELELSLAPELDAAQRWIAARGAEVEGALAALIAADLGAA